MEYPLSYETKANFTTTFIAGQFYQCIQATSCDFTNAMMYLCCQRGKEIYLVNNHGICQKAYCLRSKFQKV